MSFDDHLALLNLCAHLRILQPQRLCTRLARDVSRRHVELELLRSEEGCAQPMLKLCRGTRLCALHASLHIAPQRRGKLARRSWRGVWHPALCSSDLLGF